TLRAADRAMPHSFLEPAVKIIVEVVHGHLIQSLPWIMHMGRMRWPHPVLIARAERHHWRPNLLDDVADLVTLNTIAKHAFALEPLKQLVLHSLPTQLALPRSLRPLYHWRQALVKPLVCELLAAQLGARTRSILTLLPLPEYTESNRSSNKTSPSTNLMKGVAGFSGCQR